MCVIVDTNVAHHLAEPNDDVLPLLAWWQNPKKVNQVAIGGKLRKELTRAGREFNRMLVQHARAGRVCSCDDAEVNAEEAVVARELSEAGIRANDAHVIALARVSGARVLYTDDEESNLQAVFRDPRFVSNPRGHIYRRAAHTHLLRKACACRPPSRAK